jgi:hypothetical protein
MNEVETKIQKAYGEQYVHLFLELQESEQPYVREKATETGKRAVSYLVRAEAFDVLDTFFEIFSQSNSSSTIATDNG